MEILIGLFIIAIGSFGQSSSYVPINKVKDWSWESFWLIQGIFAWLIFPYLGATLAIPDGSSLYEILSVDTTATLKAIGYGMLWGIGGLTFGLSMRYLGVALGQSIALGTCSAFGTIIPAVISGENLFSGSGIILLIGVCVTIMGIAVIGYAGSLRSKNMSEEEKKAAVKDFALGKGLGVALLAGVMSACFALGLQAGQPLVVDGANDLFKTLPATLMVTMGGFLTNAIYCLFQNAKNKSFSDYGKTSVLLPNVMLCTLAGVLWYSQFFALGVGKSFLVSSPVMFAFSWSILMALNVVFSNVWGIILHEWKGAGRTTAITLIIGMVILIISAFLPNIL